MAETTQRPPANVPRPSMPWARRIESELDQRAKDAKAIASRHASTHDTVLALMRKMPRSGSLNYRGPWIGVEEQVGGVPWIWGGYLGALSFPGIPPHTDNVVDGHLAIITFYPDDQDFDLHDPVELTYEIHATYTNAVDYPYDVINQPSLRAFGPSTVVLEGDAVTQYNGGTIDALYARAFGEFTAGTHEMVVTATGNVQSYGTAAIVFDGTGYQGAPLTFTSVSVRRTDFTGTPNVWVPGQRKKAPTSTELIGDNFAPGDVVTYNEAMWMAVTETDGRAPTPGQWAMLAGTPADSFAGEWS